MSRDDSPPPRPLARLLLPPSGVEVSPRPAKGGKGPLHRLTSHKSPDIHLHMLETARRHGFELDTVQMPLNVMYAHYQSFEKRVLPGRPRAQERHPRHEAKTSQHFDSTAQRPELAGVRAAAERRALRRGLGS